VTGPAVARTPRRVVGVRIDDTASSGTISHDAPYLLTDVAVDDSGDPRGSMWFARWFRQERDSTQDALGEVVADWIPGGEVTAYSLTVQKTTEERGDKWVNTRVWIAEFDPGVVFPKDMLLNEDGIKFTVQSVTPVIEGDAVVKDKAMLSERVA